MFGLGCDHYGSPAEYRWEHQRGLGEQKVCCLQGYEIPESVKKSEGNGKSPYERYFE